MSASSARRRHAAVDFIVKHRRGRAGAEPEAVHRLEGESTIRRGLAEADAEALLRMTLDRTAAGGLAGFRAADLQHMPARRPGAEVMIEGDDAVHLGARQVERARDHGHRARRDAAEVRLHVVQHLDQRAVAVAVAFDGRKDAGLVRRRVTSTALIAAAPGARRR